MDQHPYLIVDPSVREGLRRNREIIDSVDSIPGRVNRETRAARLRDFLYTDSLLSCRKSVFGFLWSNRRDVEYMKKKWERSSTAEFLFEIPQEKSFPLGTFVAVMAIFVIAVSILF